MFKVVTMPDFFLDRLVSYEGDIKHFYEELVAVAKREGGSVDCVEQTELRGGNAANTAVALASLDAKVHPIIFTSQFGLHLLKFYFKPLGVDLSHVKTDGQTSITTAVEFSSRRGKVNVMLRDLGSLADFSFDHLDPEDFDLLREAEYVCVFNWAGTRCYGTELAEGVFRYVKEEGKGKTYYDTADPNPNKKEIPRLMKKLFLSDLVDILSVNENEAVTYASQLNEREVKKIQKKMTADELTKECGRILAENLSARIDLHTSSFAASFTKNCKTVVPAFNVPVLRTTGAGDAWNAGNILGDACGLADADRLALANAVAAYYISNSKAEHPNIIQLRKFLERMLNQKIE
jgi:sugar/nucleoside kinase (ribokinase family)